MTKARAATIRYQICKPETLHTQKRQTRRKAGAQSQGPFGAARLPAAGTGTKRTVPMQASVSVNGHRSPCRPACQGRVEGSAGMFQRLREKRQDEGGFTLIELLVVILIIAIL